MIDTRYEHNLSAKSCSYCNRWGSEDIYVIYGSSGVCKVGEVTTLNLENIPKDKEYYVLFPKNNGGTIYVPVDVASTKMRKVITKEEADYFITNNKSRSYGNGSQLP